MLKLVRDPIELVVREQGGYSMLPPNSKHIIDALTLGTKREELYSFLGWETSGYLTFGNEVTAQLPMALEQFHNIHPVFLNADVHAFLNGKGTWEEISKYSKIMKEQIGYLFPVADVFDGSEFQLGPKDATIELDAFSKKLGGMKENEQVKALIEKVEELADNSNRSNSYKSTFLNVLKLPKGELEHAVSGMVSDETASSNYIYGALQLTDTHFFDEYEGVRIFTAGDDQKKLYGKARSTFGTKFKWRVPTFAFAPMLIYLGNELDKNNPTRLRKMSKSEGPQYTLFLNDTEEEIREKISKSFCPPYSPNSTSEGQPADMNPNLELIRLVINSHVVKMKVERPPSKGGDVEEEPMKIIEMYKRHEIHPQDLKNANAKAIVELIRQIGLPPKKSEDIQLSSRK